MLGIKAQNLRDQAARLEGLQESSEDITLQESRATNDLGNTRPPTSTTISDDEKNQNFQRQESQNANFPPNDSFDLHTNPSLVSGEHQDIERDETIDENPFAEVPGSLPEFSIVDTPQSIVWGQSEGKVITVSSSDIINAYNEITSWRKNIFLVPYGKIGREFIDQITKDINDWNNSTEGHHIALKAAFVLLALVLQKPSQKSKARDHQECLTKRLALWKDGKIAELLREGRSVQKRLVRSHQKKDPPHKAKIFAKLVMEGQINSALRYLTVDGCGGVLSLNDDVMKQLHEKHPKAQPAKLGSLLFGPVDEVHESVYNEITGEMIREAALRTKGAGGPSNVDANGFQRILASKSFKTSASNLCDALATLTRRLCTEYIDPATIEPILASRLIG